MNWPEVENLVPARKVKGGTSGGGGINGYEEAVWGFFDGITEGNSGIFKGLRRTVAPEEGTKVFDLNLYTTGS